VLIGWVPLILLAIVQSAVLRADDVTSLLREPGLYARYLIAVPLMVFAEALCVPRLNAVVRHFIASGIIIERDRARFDSAIASTQRLLRSVVAEIGVVALAYLVVAAAILSHPVDQLPGWAVSRGIMPIYSLVGWWHILISLPL